MSALVALLGVEQPSPRIEAPLVEPQWLGRQTFDLALKLTGADGPITLAAQLPAAGAHPDADTPLRSDRQHSRVDLLPYLQRDARLHSLAFTETAVLRHI
jgi:hypothetical protein